MFEKAKTTFIPMLWFNQRAALTEDLAGMLKMLLVLPNLGTYTSYGVIGIGSLLLLIGLLLISFNKNNDTEGEELINDS